MPPAIITCVNDSACSVISRAGGPLIVQSLRAVARKRYTVPQGSAAPGSAAASLRRAPRSSTDLDQAEYSRR
jgi:hypothetical protein